MASPRWAMAAETMAGDRHETVYSGSCPMCAIPEIRSPSSEEVWRRIQVPGSEAKTGPHVNVDVVGGGELDGPGLQDSRAGVGELEHLFVADRGEFARIGHHPGICGEYPGHIGENVAFARAQHRGEGDRGGV